MQRKTPTEIRVDIIHRHVDPASVRILEIGAYDRPTFSPTEVNIKFLDYRTTEELREAAARNPGRSAQNVATVDYVAKSNILSNEVDAEFDLIIGNHLIEHIPNLLEWLIDLRSVLTKDGCLFLSVPDRRFTFDYLRRETILLDVLRRFADRERKPTFWDILDSRYHHRPLQGSEGWHPHLIEARIREKRLNWAEAIELANKEAKMRYCDVHCSVFTKDSFEQLFRDMLEAKLAPFIIEEISDVPTGLLEFYVVLKKNENFESLSLERCIPRSAEPAPAVRNGGTGNPTAELRGGCRMDESRTASSAPRIIFMHIAKTAGTLVNKVITSTLGTDVCAAECEAAFMHDRKQFEDILETKRFLSGHIYFNDLKCYDLSQFRLVTLLRDPVDHLISHICWLDHYNLPEFKHHLMLLDSATQEVVRLLQKVNFDDAGSLDLFLQRLLTPRAVQYFDNCQSRYFLAGHASRIEYSRPLTLDLRGALWANVESFDIIGMQDNVGRFLTSVGALIGERLDVGAVRVNENLNPRTIDITKPFMREVLTKRLTLDLWLFSEVKRRLPSEV